MWCGCRSTVDGGRYAAECLDSAAQRAESGAVEVAHDFNHGWRKGLRTTPLNPNTPNPAPAGDNGSYKFGSSPKELQVLNYSILFLVFKSPFPPFQSV